MGSRRRSHRHKSRALGLKIRKEGRPSPVIQSAMPAPSSAKKTWMLRWQPGLAVFLFVAFFLLYLVTTSRSVPTGDSGELIAAAWRLGVPHAPGYPTFTMLSHLAGYLPFGTLAFRLNLLSALLDALALGILFWGTVRFLQVERGIASIKRQWLIPVTGAIAGVGLLAVSNAFWLYSTVAEVFALNNLFAAITLVLMLEWVRQPGRRGPLLLSGLFAGLGMTNQHTFILLAPALFTLLIGGLVRWRRETRSAMPARKSRTEDPGWRLRDIGTAAGLFTVGLIPYLYLFIAAQTDPPINFGNPSSLGSLWRVLLRSDYGTFTFAVDILPGDRLQQLFFIGRYFLHSFTVVGVLLAVLGIAWFVRKRRLEGLGLGLAFLFSGPLFVVYANPSLQSPITQGVFEQFYILPSIPFALFVAAGAVFLIEMVAKAVDKSRVVFTQRALTVAGLIAAVAMVVSLAVIHFPSVNLSNNRVVEYYGEDLLEPLESNAMLITADDYNYSAIVYAQLVLGIRTDVIALHVPLLRGAWYVDQQRRLHPEISIPFPMYDGGNKTSLADLIQSNIGQRPIYGAGDLKEDLSQNYDVVYWGLTVRYLEKGETTDAWGLMRPEIDHFANLHYPEKAYPPEYWESVIAQHYGRLAFLLAYDRQQPEAQADADFVERMYRIAILNAPDLTSSYKDLGLLLWKNGGSTSEIIALWEKYLQLVPDDPENETIRLVLASLKEQP